MIDLVLKNLKQTELKTNLDETVPLESLVDTVKTLMEIQDEVLRFLHKGRVLKLDKSLADNGVATGDLIVIMGMKSLKKPNVLPSSSVPAPVSAPAPVLTPAPVLAPAPVSAPVSSNGNVSGVSTVPSIWTTPNPSDTQQIYSLEQIHIIMPIFMQFVLQNDFLRQALLTDPDGFHNIFAAPQFRQIIGQLMTQANGLLNSVRTGTTPTVVLNFGNSDVGFDGFQEMDLTGNDYTGDNDSTSSTNSDEGSHNSHDHDHADDELSEQDQTNITQLMTFTGASKAIAYQAYQASNHNLDMAAELLMQMM